MVPAAHADVLLTATDESDPSRRALSILLIEDDAGDAILVEELIADAAGDGMRVVHETTLHSACERIRADPPDCTLLDLHLPDADGVDALGQLQECDSSVPVVVLTGLNDERVGAAAVAAGAQDYLVKGRVEADVLRRAVQYSIERKRAELTAAELQASRLRAAENSRLERGLLPSPLLADDTAVDVVARYRPTRTNALLGGDFYDVVQTDDATVHVLIGDVCGHGPDEAALGVALRIAWRTLVLAGVEPERHLPQLDRILRAERGKPYVFATMTVLTLRADSNRVQVTRAGHPPLLVHGPDGVRWLEPPGDIAVGLPGAGPWVANDIELPPDTGLILLTDGLFEGRAGAGGQRLGEAGLLRIAQSIASLPSGEFVDALIEKACALAEPHGGLEDDVAVLRVQVATGGRSRRL